MSVRKEISSDGTSMHINVEGRFDYRMAREFRDTYKNAATGKCVNYRVNLSRTDFMDSAALGMLLLLLEHARSHGGEVIIENPGQKIGSILQIANIEQLFNIEHGPVISADEMYEHPGAD